MLPLQSKCEWPELVCFPLCLLVLLEMFNFSGFILYCDLVLLQQMWNQEKDHLKKFDELMVAYRVRPTVLLPFWNVAGFVLGESVLLLLLLPLFCEVFKCVNYLYCFRFYCLYMFGTTITGAGSALLGKKGAMACTVAVEESISDHYNSQIRTLMEEDPEKYKELLQVFNYDLKSSLAYSLNYLV